MLIRCILRRSERLLGSRCDWRRNRFTLLRGGFKDNLVNGRFEDLDGVGKRLLGPKLAFGIVALHTLRLRKSVVMKDRASLAHFHFDTKDALSKEDVTNGVIDKVTGRLAGVDHKAISELHGFCTGSTKFARNNYFATLRTGLHNESEHAIAGTEYRELKSDIGPVPRAHIGVPSDSKATEELVA